MKGANYISSRQPGSERRVNPVKNAKAVEFKTGRWTDEEHDEFLEAIRLYGKDWDRIQKRLGTRDAAHCRSHAQKFLIKLEKSLNGGKKQIPDAQFFYEILNKKIEKPNRKFRFLEHFD